MCEHHSVIVIGAGLSGLYTAWQLHQQQVDVLVLEARSRVGGRILSVKPRDQDSAVDLGPAWIWPAFQHRIQALVDELDLTLFRQYTQGDLLYEMNANEIHRHAGPSAHNESCRIAGGNAELVEKLHARLPKSSVHTDTHVRSIKRDGLEIEANNAGQQKLYSADRIILALPPGLLLKSIEFTPALDDEVAQDWQNTPTWMASHSKMMYVYDQPFWRAQGLSGEVFSRQGPLSEIYDGSPADESFYALTSFVGLNAMQRTQMSDAELEEACMSQLERLFGEDSRKVRQVLTSDWSREPFTTTERDLNMMQHHPEYPATAPHELWDERLLLAGTEVAREQGGYLEGALEAADEATALILS